MSYPRDRNSDAERARDASLTESEKASTYGTFRHIERVRNLLNECVLELLIRGELHDQSKLEPPEVGAYADVTPKLAGLTYGSQEYKAQLAEMRPAIDHHYANNKHHPEHCEHYDCPVCGQIYFARDRLLPAKQSDGKRYCTDCYPDTSPSSVDGVELVHHSGIDQMDLFDLLEMVVDWKAASERHNDGDILKSIEINRSRFGISDQLCSIIRNTVIRKWVP